MSAELDQHRDEALTRIGACGDAESLRAVEREYLDKGGVVAKLLAEIPSLEPKDRPVRGAEANQLKAAILAALQARGEELDREALEAERSGAGFDPTLPAAATERGSLHPITQVKREVEDLFLSMGYTILDGPEVELGFYNFDALNIPADHPAREEHDTFWCDEQGGLVLRTHTSPVQIRAMEGLEPPFRIAAPGRVFRNEAVDSTHDHTFHQVEGLAVGEGLSVGHLTGTLKAFLRQVLGEQLEIRLRPGYFPFVEPGFEVDIQCPFCSGSGCRICKQSGWIEYCGCGMVHPNVLRAGGIDTDRYTGFAFGMGLDRLVMMRYGVDDIRHFMSADLRFLEQF